MQFIKLRTTDLKQGAVSHFCVKSYGNDFTMDNPVSETIVLQLNNEPDIAELFPFVITSVNVPREQLATNLLDSVDMRKIYDSVSVEEQQEFGLDPLFVAGCSIEPTKPRLLQANLSPPSVENSMLAIISTYGACHIFSKNRYDRLWKQIGNITKILIADVFPIEKSPTDLKSYVELKNFLNLYVVTTCVWHNNGNIIYTANAAGFIIAFEIEYETNENSNVPETISWKLLAKISTDIGRIAYIKSFDDYLIAVGVNGVMRLFRFYKDSNFECLDFLWDHKDRMCCCQIVVQKFKANGGYMISYAKGAHVICMRISKEGRMLGKSCLYIPGIKISGIELFHENELIVTTISANIMRVTYSCVQDKDHFVSIHLKADPVAIPGLDVENLEIIGVGATKNKALWLFITHRNKELPMSKQSVLPSHLMLCKPNNVDPLAQLNNIPIDTMDPYEDLMMALRMDIWHSNNIVKYNQQRAFFSNFSQHKILNDIILRKIQIQLEISRVIYRRLRYKTQTSNEVLRSEIDMMEIGAQTMHILLRLEYFQGLIDNKRLSDASAGFNTLTEFQRRAAYSMRKHFDILTNKLKMYANESSKDDTINQTKENIKDFVEIAFQNLNLKCQDFEIIDDTDYEEKCLICNEAVNNQELVCTHGHNLRRCCVSFVQLPWFNDRFCLQCETMALEYEQSNDVLLELFPSSESVKCTLCRHTFVQKKTT